MSRIIALCTDFGLQDTYVGAMKAVMLRIAPDATLVDITHGVPRQSVSAGALALASVQGLFPEGAVFLAVVDPGVGTARRPIAVRTARSCYVAPDNGLLSLVLEREAMLEAVHLTDTRYWREPVSQTFHGRDIFAPVAAHLAAGVSLRALGEPMTDLVTLAVTRPRQDGSGAWLGEVIHVDVFGNLISNIPAGALLGKVIMVQVGSLSVTGLSGSYAAVAEGAPLALLDSHGYLEVAVCRGSAAELAVAGMGSPVRVQSERAGTL